LAQCGHGSPELSAEVDGQKALSRHCDRRGRASDASATALSTPLQSNPLQAAANEVNPLEPSNICAAHLEWSEKWSPALQARSGNRPSLSGGPSAQAIPTHWVLAATKRWTIEQTPTLKELGGLRTGE
jgi:hypothetical protein